jgi:hypothetical protein
MKRAIEFDNRKVHLVLRRYRKWHDATEDFPMLEHVLEGVRRLDMGGNTRPLGMQKLFWLLRDLDVVSVQAMQELTRCSEKHCSKLCMFVRVASRAFAPYVANVLVDDKDRFVYVDDNEETDEESWPVECPSMSVRPFLSVGTSMPA